MSAEVPLLTLEQVDELSSIVHNIQHENKKKLEEALSELVDISATNILALYRLVTDEWSKKQKIVDNLCHFSLTMMATVQFLWEQRDLQNERLQTAESTIETLQRQLDEVVDLNQLYRQKISEAETHIESIAQAKERIEQFVRSQSCIDFSGELENNLESIILKKCSAGEEVEALQAEQLVKQRSAALLERESEIENLREEKKKLELQLEEALEEKELTKMELELAEIAIKDALTYKTSFRSLIQSNSSKLDDRPRAESNIHYYDAEVEGHSLLNHSFESESRNVLSSEFASKEDLIHFASTPCLLLNDSIEQIDLDHSLSSLKNRLQAQQPENPFKKKREADELLSSKQEDVNLELNSFIEERRNHHSKEEHNKTFDLKLQSQQSSFNQNFYPNNYPESAIVNDKRSNQINKLKASKSKIMDKQETYESSLISTSPKRRRSNQITPSLISNESSISKFYNFFTKKVVKNRIKVK